jgi:hypothetical protein
MVNERLIENIKTHFSEIIQEKQIFGILLFGSVIYDKQTNRSDIDICIVAPKEEAEVLLSFIWEKVNVKAHNYDVRIFSNLPLYIKIQIIKDGLLIYSTNKFDLYEYFYFYRKIWQDQKHRQELSRDEVISML